MRDFLDFFVDDGGQPYWKPKMLKEYLKTLSPEDAYQYESDLVDFIVKKGTKFYDNAFLKKLDRFPPGTEISYEESDDGKFIVMEYDSYISREQIAENVLKFNEEFTGKSIAEYNFGIMDVTGDTKPNPHLVKLKLKPDTDTLELCLRFREYFFGLNHYTHPKAAKYLFDNYDFSDCKNPPTLSTLTGYISRGKRKG